LIDKIIVYFNALTNIQTLNENIVPAKALVLFIPAIQKNLLFINFLSLLRLWQEVEKDPWHFSNLFQGIVLNNDNQAVLNPEGRAVRNSSTSKWEYEYDVKDHNEHQFHTCKRLVSSGFCDI
jgi:hypothetical protein